CTTQSSASGCQRPDLKFNKVVAFCRNPPGKDATHKNHIDDKGKNCMKSQTRYITLVLAAIFLLSTCNIFAWSQSTPNTTNWKTTRVNKHLTIRINPDANLSLYNTVQLGNVAYTGPAGKFKQKDSDNLVKLLHDSLERDLSTAKLSRSISATGTLTL